MTCTSCDKRGQCVTPCKPVNAYLWKDNHVMEKHYNDHITVFPGSMHERQFCELTDKQLNEMSETDTIPWSSENFRLKKTKVFVERFFNKVPCKELAERYRVKENTIVCMYAQAVEQVQKIVEVLDARRFGVKATKGTRGAKFTEDQKYFLLVNVFGFSGHEVARLYNLDQQIVNLKVKHLTEKYRDAFNGLTVKSGQQNQLDTG